MADSIWGTIFAPLVPYFPILGIAAVQDQPLLPSGFSPFTPVENVLNNLGDDNAASDSGTNAEPWVIAFIVIIFLILIIVLLHQIGEVV